MEQNIIVGGGVTGLVTACFFKQKNIPFMGLEREERLGGLSTVGHPRSYYEPSQRLLSELISDLEWTSIDEEAHTLSKGEWKKVEGEKLEEEEYFLGNPFQAPSRSYGSILNSLMSAAGEHFQLRKNVISIEPAYKKIICQDGSELNYEKLVWTCPLSGLLKVWKGDKLPLQRLLKSAQEAMGGMALELELKGSIFPLKNTVVFPFRFKDHKLRALGSAQGRDGKTFLSWMLFLPAEVFEDREEMAKCVRTLRRELEKEFTELKSLILTERIVYLPTMAGKRPTMGKSLEVFPNTFYVGAELALGEETTELRHLDLSVLNASALASSFVNSAQSAEV